MDAIKALFIGAIVIAIISIGLAFHMNHRLMEVEAKADSLQAMINEFPFYSPDSMRFGELTMREKGIIISAFASAYDVDPMIAMSIAHVESRWNPSAIGAMGEVGLMQMMPNTARGLGVSPEELYNPYKALRFGLEYYSDMMEIFGTDIRAQVAYNGGPTLARKVQFPSEFSYVQKVAEAHQHINNWRFYE